MPGAQQPVGDDSPHPAVRGPPVGEHHGGRPGACCRDRRIQDRDGQARAVVRADGPLPGGHRAGTVAAGVPTAAVTVLCTTALGIVVRALVLHGRVTPDCGTPEFPPRIR
ncbi:hypothetical protein ACH40E_31415 [Streptomyces acidicola]|uniref:hypothetical protein n=1 Tax=Streptomyces acidicola TaxID=2596892 RepID=UPI0037A45803